jgi:lipoprotein-anchoring transpeptidase ErfK/SrfK
LARYAAAGLRSGRTKVLSSLAEHRRRNPPVSLWLALFVSLGLGAAPPVQAREVVRFPTAMQPGSIVVRTGERRLYLVRDDGTALRYPVAVGRPDRQWFGESVVLRKHVRPAWAPPEGVRRDHPTLPAVVPAGAPNNPLGERALTLPNQYAIHGTNRPASINTFASYGCIRMFNEDVIHLFDRVEVGARVVVER